MVDTVELRLAQRLVIPIVCLLGATPGSCGDAAHHVLFDGKGCCLTPGAERTCDVQALEDARRLGMVGAVERPEDTVAPPFR